MAYNEVPAASVNTKWVGKWDKTDVLRFVKTYQDRESFEGTGTAQFNKMNDIIHKKKISGKQVEKCDTIIDIMQLFEKKINSVTARVLLDGLNMERAMFHKMELSKRLINQNKWQPKRKEKIRLAELTKVKPYRSYPATIQKVLAKEICVTYDGYPKNPAEWIKKNQWAGRITILDDNKSQSSATNLAQGQKLNKTTSVRNAVQQGQKGDVDRQLKRPKSVPPTDPPFVPPFRNKKVTKWDNDDVTDWIDTIQIKAEQKYQAKIKQHKFTFKNAAVANQLTGKLLLKYKNADKLFKDYKQYKLSQAFCNNVFGQLKNIVNAEAAFPNFSQLSVEKWSKEDLKEWVQSLGLPKEKKIIAGINKNDMTGKDFAGCNNTQDIMDDFSVDGATAAKLFFELKSLKGNTTSYKKDKKPVSNVTDDPSPPYSPPDKNDHKTNVYQNEPPKEPVRVEFYEGQKIDAKDGGWHSAIIKQVGQNQYGQRCVKVGWLLDQWASERFDKTWAEYEWDKRIRDPETHLPYSKLAARQSSGNQGGNDSGGFVRYGQKDSTGQKGKAYTYKHIDKWTSKELQEWINSVKLNNSYKKTVIEHIVEQEITGADFNSMHEVSDIKDSFEIAEGPAKMILGALNKVRSNSKDYNTNQSSNVQQGRGIIGLDNLRNTCFINSVIQGLLQTPGLIEYLRKFAGGIDKGGKSDNSWRSWLTGNNSRSERMAPTMLDAFIEVAAAAMQASGYDSVPPKAIVKHLRDSDVKFRDGEQGDALSAVSKMTELLDKDIIKREKQKGKKGGVKRHTGSWLMDMKDQDDEDDVIEGQFMLYNPYESTIREYIHFVERNTFTCLKCGWQELRYDIKEKVLLPLKDHLTTICLDIFIPSIKPHEPVFFKEKCVILGYCPIQTLRYQIFDTLRAKAGKNFKFPMKSVDQISIRTIRVNKNKLLYNWIQECDETEECNTLINSKKSIFAVVDSHKKNKSSISVTTFNVRLDKKGEADPKASYIEFEDMKDGECKSFEKIQYKDYPQKHMHVFYGQKIFDSNFKCKITKYSPTTLVVIWTHANATKRYPWNRPKMEEVDPIWQCEISIENKGTIPNYGDCVEFLQTKIKGYKDFAKKMMDKDLKKEFKKQWIDSSLSKALEVYKGFAADQNRAIQWVIEAFSNSKQSFIEQKNPIIQNIGEGFKTYCSTKVLDRGAVLKCRGKCKAKCDVFKQETKIVRFSEVLIFAIDRYNAGQKFSELVGYNEFETFDKQKYELYAVCNHSGGLGYGHYWAFVKGYDDNEWYEANDRSISSRSLRSVINQETAILLFYKKKKK